MPNANRQRAILAAQKVRVKTDPQPTPAKLTAEQKREMYAPKSALEIIPNRPPMPLRVVRTTAKATGWGLGMITAIAGGILIGESKRGFRS